MAEQPVGGEEAFTDEKRAAKERDFRQLAEMLQGVLSSAEGGGAKDKSKELITRFAADVDTYIQKIHDAATNEEAMAISTEGEAKKDKWMKMLNMLAEKEGVAKGGGKGSIPEEAALKQAEAQMLKMSLELRRISKSDGTAPMRKLAEKTGRVTQGIGFVADQVDQSLEEFRGASTSQGKWAAYAKMEEVRAKWLESMSAMKESMESGLEEARVTEERRQKEHVEEISALQQQAEAQKALKAMLDPEASAPHKGGVDKAEEEEDGAPADAEKRASCYAAEDFTFDAEGNFAVAPSSSSALDPSNSCDV